MKIDETYKEEGCFESEQTHYSIYEMSDDEENILWEALEKFYKDIEDLKKKNIVFQMLQIINDTYGG